MMEPINFAFANLALGALGITLLCCVLLAALPRLVVVLAVKPATVLLIFAGFALGAMAVIP